MTTRGVVRGVKRGVWEDIAAGTASHWPRIASLLPGAKGGIPGMANLRGVNMAKALLPGLAAEAAEVVKPVLFAGENPRK